MENLPVEMLELIVQQLSLQDLINCSAVSRQWRFVFNQDWIWRPHCSPELEEPLRTIPSVMTPAIVIPESENSTLPPVCYWRRTLMRENLLWKNWGAQNNVEVHRIEDKEVLSADFLTDTLVVVWYTDRIEIWDVMSRPVFIPVCLARSHTMVKIGRRDKHIVIGSMLIVVKEYSVEAYKVDMTEKSIRPKYCISFAAPNGVEPNVRRCNRLFNLNNASVQNFVVKKHNCMFSWEESSDKINIYDLNTGEILKREEFPMIIEMKRVGFKIKSSSTSDFIGVVFTYKEDARFFSNLFVYDIVKLDFVPNVMFDLRCPGKFALHHQMLAYFWSKDHTLVVYDLESKEVINVNVDSFYGNLTQLFVSENSFIGIFDGQISLLSSLYVKRYSPLLKTFTDLNNTPFKSDGPICPIVTSKSFTVMRAGHRILLWRGNRVIDIPISDSQESKFNVFEINQSCTIMLEYGFGQVQFRYWW